jgi:fermentation-respiration switch protein FrsA (DUF1100 family)
MKLPRCFAAGAIALALLGAGCVDAPESTAAASSLPTCKGPGLATPDDPAERGPFAVGARTAAIAGLTVEVWYPAAPGSDAGKPKARYDLREQLRDVDQGKIPDQDNPYQPCDCVRDLPLDTEHGPYPLVVFIHGTAGFRTQSLTFMTHWASRGFVVVAADHPGIRLKDALDFKLSPHQDKEANAVLDALAEPSGDAAFLSGHLVEGAVAVSGHSAGGNAAKKLSERDGVKVLVPMAASGSIADSQVSSTLILGAMTDGVVPYASQQKGFIESPKKKRLVGLSNAGHLAFTDLCSIGADQGGLLQIAIDHGIDVNPLIAKLATDGCKEGQLPYEKGWAIVNAASAAALEETLMCRGNSATALEGLKARFADVGEYQEEL